MVQSSEQKKIEAITNFKKAFKDMISTSKAAYERSNRKETRLLERTYTKEEIKRIVQKGTAVERAALSEYFFKASGIYKRIILHYATFLTYSWILVPHLKKPKDDINSSKNSKTYYTASDFCGAFQIERKCTYFSKEILVKGAYYGLINSTKEYVAIQDLPFDYCRSRFKNTQEIDIVEFDVRFFDTIREEKLRKEILETYPKIVQKAYWNFKYRDKDPWLFLPAEMGIYFNFFDERPFFLDLIPLLDDLDDYKEIDKKRNLLALKKIFVQQVALDHDKLVFEPDEAELMHEGVLTMLSDNPDVDVVTTYNKCELLDLGSKDDEKTEVEDMQNLIYESAGISKELFSATTEAGIEYSLKNDLSMMMMLGKKYAHFFTVLLNNRFSTTKMNFRVLMLPISHYNSDDYISKAKDLAAFGYSFLTPILSTGLDQISLADLKLLENELLDLDEVLKPLQSAYTQSGKVNANAVSAQAAKNANAQEKEEEKKETEEDNEEEDDKKEVKEDVDNSNK